MKANKAWTPIFIAFLLHSGAIAAAGHSGEIELPEIEFQDAQRKPFNLSDRLIINVKKSDLASAGGVEGLRFRVFRGTIRRLMKGGFKSEDNCDYYLSRSLEVETYNGGLRFSVLFDAGWLKMTGNSEFRSQPYVLVVEKSNNTGDLLKLHPDQIRSYFSRGYQFTVTAPRSVTQQMREDFLVREKTKFKETQELHKAALQPSPTEEECRSHTRIALKTRPERPMVAYLCEETAGQGKIG